MAIKPIEGFYVHDEETGQDGVGKVDYDNLANLPSIPKKAIVPGWNVKAGGIYISGNSIVVNENGFALFVNGAPYYIAPTDRETVTTFSLPGSPDTSYALVLDMAGLTSPDIRINPNTVLAVVQTGQLRGMNTKEKVVVANYYKGYWQFVAPFDYFSKYIDTKHPDYTTVLWNSTADNVYVIGDDIIVTPNGFALFVNGAPFYIASTDYSTTHTFSITGVRSTTYALVLEVSELTQGVRNNPADVMRVVQTGELHNMATSSYYIVAYYFKGFWRFVAPFDYFSEEKNSVVSPYIANGCNVIAHQKNTLSSFEQAIADGYKVIEIDIALTSDNVVVVNHGDTLTYSGRQYTISTSTWNDIHESVPTLERLDTLLLLAKRSNVCLEFDLTNSGWTPEKVVNVYNTTARLGMLSNVYCTAPDALARAVLDISRRWAVCVSGISSTSSLDKSSDLVNSTPVCIYSVPQDSLTQALVDSIHTIGGRAKTWTVDVLEDANTYLNYGIDGIITNTIKPSDIQSRG